jgi:uncharacterized membrane protein
LKKETFDLVKKELLYILILFLIIIAVFKIIFFKEGIIVIFRTVLSLFWLFVIPGYFIMLYWEKSLGFLERFVMGIALAIAASGILSYYLGISGINIKFHIFLLPIVFIIIGVIATLKSSKT